MKAPKIQKVEFGNIVINGETYSDDNIVLYWDGIDIAEKNHEITKTDFESLLLREPDAVVLGIGFKGMVGVDKEVRRIAKTENKELFILPTQDALKKFQELIRSGKKAAALIHPTC